MALPELTQASTLLERASRILLLVPEQPSIDALASMIAMYLYLQSQEHKEITEVSASHVPQNLQFLPGSSQVQMQPRQQSDIVLDIAGPTTIASVHHESLQGGLRLHILLPEGQSINKEQLETLIRALPYDLVITFGTSDLETLGSLFTQYADFFYNTPIINIDHRANNEDYGTVNLVDITAGSVAEVTHELISSLKPDIDSDTATALYAGIVAGTDSFQKPSTTPRSFQIAAKLMEAKANREAVIQHLVKTKPLPLIKFVGRLYARLRTDEHAGLFWSIVRPIDFAESGAKNTDIASAMQELANNIAGFTAAFLVQDENSHYTIHLLLGKGLRQRSQAITETLGANRDNGLIHFPIEAANLESAEQQALDKIRNVLR